MIDSQLIMLEGLPSTGKTTNARFIHAQLERNSVNAEWIHEVAMPHPVLFFDEAGMTYDEYDKFIASYPVAADIFNDIAVFRESTIGVHLPEMQWRYSDKVNDEVYQALLEYDVWNFPLEVYRKFALEKWAHFTAKALRSDKQVYVMDSAIFQFQIFCFLFKNRPHEELQGFVDRITDIILPLNPCMIYLHRENTEATIDYLENDRGTSYLDYIWNRDKDQPYYTGMPPGSESFKQFLRDYAGMADLLFDSFPAKKISLDISSENWVSIEAEILSFLNIDRVPDPHVVPENGVYENESFDYTIEILGLLMTDPTGKTRKLFPKTHNEFYVDWLPVVLRFEDSRIVISGSKVSDRWTETGMTYIKRSY